MTGLGQALRWLRERQARKQYRVADAAGITKGMLSAYETGRQRPSLESLEKLLETLGCDLNDLHNALQIVNGRPDRMRSWNAWEPGGWPATPAAGTRAAIAASPGFTIHELDPGAEYPAIADPGAAAISEVGEIGEVGEVGDTRQAPGRAAQGLGTRGIGGEPFAETVRSVAELYRVLGFDPSGRARRLPVEEEAALSQMVGGFHGLLRYWHRSLGSLRSQASSSAGSKPGELTDAATSAGRPFDDH
jgi:transcriptional regulator with XRE-family HTH domain